MGTQRLVLTPLAAALLWACSATPLSPEYRSELDARIPLEADLGGRIALFDEKPSRMVGRQGSDGRAHLWVIDGKRSLHHVEVEPAGALSSERIGTVGEDLASMAFDAVESPPGTWRVLAGSSQFVSTQRGAPWQEVAGNRCQRFARIGDRLLCGFVMSGEELGTPTRTDVYAGIFVIVPFAIPVHRQSKKLVLAEAVGASWLVRIVLDPSDALDAGRGFLLGADSEGNIHVVYFVGRGGALLLIGPGIAGGFAEATPRYAKVEAASLHGALPTATPEGVRRHEGVDGRPIDAPRWMVNGYGFAFPSARLAVDPTSGRVEGLMAVRSDSSPPIMFRGQKTRLNGIFDIELRQGAWQPIEQIVLADWPRSGANYHQSRDHASVAFDDWGGLHALAPYCTEGGFWSRCVGGISYVVKRNGRWSRPLTVGGRYTHQDPLLVIPGTRRSLVAWVEHGAGLVGQWTVFRDAGAQ